jgi:hypothetical protein
MTIIEKGGAIPPNGFTKNKKATMPKMVERR